MSSQSRNFKVERTAAKRCLVKAYITTYNKYLAKHYFLRGAINDRVSHGIDNKLNKTYYTNYHL